ncbi:dolichol phosphate mannosyltransferase subunit 3 [Golovinomyces cichoracearum]|uniref:Dolichol-phosphate mannosyltransferase subunit 3 n=1 Tax=Golovinomyces cichoracearum TaxID=62708 RepID=A0A420J7Y5_9PEZI|nr:dolichol phosphate mannosyltransferase subunit 3 [Golovinomyces cichoracearum]
MTRAQHTISIGLLSISLYLTLYLELVQLPVYIPGHVITIFPFWAIVSFGAYLLAKLGYGLLTFNDVPEAHKELMCEIELARRDLRSLGVDVD